MNATASAPVVEEEELIDEDSAVVDEDEPKRRKLNYGGGWNQVFANMELAKAAPVKDNDTGEIPANVRLYVVKNPDSAKLKEAFVWERSSDFAILKYIKHIAPNIDTDVIGAKRRGRVATRASSVAQFVIRLLKNTEHDNSHMIATVMNDLTPEERAEVDKFVEESKIKKEKAA